MQLVAEHYCTSDGRVNYRKFCNLMEHGKIVHYDNSTNNICRSL